MDFLSLSGLFRLALFGGCMLLTGATATFIARYGRDHREQTLPWFILSLTAVGLALPAFGFALFGLGLRFQAWVGPLAMLALFSLPLNFVTLVLYIRQSATLQPPPAHPLAKEPVPPMHETQLSASKRPFFQPVCRNPDCRAPMAPDQRHCVVCGWDSQKPVKAPQEMPALSGEAHMSNGNKLLAFVVVRSGPLNGANFQLSRETLIGSGPRSQIRLKDAFVSEEHTVIRRKGSGFVIYDIQGTYLVQEQGKQLLDVPYTLKHGDLFEVGQTQFIFMQVE